MDVTVCWGVYNETCNRLSTIISNEAKASKERAIQNSLADSGASGITMETDACFSAFRNAKRSITFGLCNETHTVLADKVKSTNHDDSSVQRHETIATKEILNDFKQEGIKVRCIVHDSNNSVSKVVKDDFPEVKEQKDVWHVIKNVMSSFKKISKGTKKTENICWHGQLFDKYDGIKNHIWYSIMHSGNDETLLRGSLDAIVSHYQGYHESCRLTSHCVRNPRYAPSRVLLTDPIAIDLLSKFVHDTSIYKNPHLVLEGLSTSYVEAANNALRSFLPKRHSFGDTSFQVRVDLFILHWNENVNRPFKRAVVPQNEGTPRENSGRKYQSKKTFQYLEKIWISYLEA
ncbi:unnamed protein product [Owenia fusiformis]|uniref:Mutator-like transposase domain-containing protein n=1 Tax=Owenia fusiformis TaxID=6347 RepID=A0A8S4NKH1_OWEFU|nr:unnamed protein product [Owenia fusiformis]